MEITIEYYLTMDFIYPSPSSAGTTDNSADMYFGGGAYVFFFKKKGKPLFPPLINGKISSTHLHMVGQSHKKDICNVPR